MIEHCIQIQSDAMEEFISEMNSFLFNLIYFQNDK